MELGDIALFADTPSSELASLLPRLGEIRVRPGHLLMEQGDPAEFFALVVEGEATVERIAPTEPEILGTLACGDIVGELGLLRCRPRGASVVATSDLVVVAGDAEAFHMLVDLPGVHGRLHRIVSQRIAENVTPVRLVLRDGTDVALRPLLPSDREALFQSVRDASAETLRRRFFTAGVPKAVLEYLIDVDYVDHFAWVCVDSNDDGVGIGRHIRSDTHDNVAEFAFAVNDVWQGRGVGTILLGAVAVSADAAGVDRLTATFLHDNEPVRAVLRKTGATFGVVEPGIASADLPTAAAIALLPDGDAVALRAAVRDVVSAAGLALT